MTEVAPCHQGARNPCPSKGNDSNPVNFMLSVHVMEFNHEIMKSKSCSYKCRQMVRVSQLDALFNCPALESSKSLLTFASCTEMQRLKGSQVFDHASTFLSHNAGYKLSHAMFETRMVSLEKAALIHRLGHVKQCNLRHASEFQWLQRASMTGGPWESVVQRDNEVCGHCGPLEATNEIRIVGK